MSNQSLPYMADPKDIAAVSVFLASDAGKAVSGQFLPIDGDMQRNCRFRGAEAGGDEDDLLSKQAARHGVLLQ